MSNVVMLKRAFNQAVATDAVRFTDRETDFLVIRNFMIDYAKRNNVEISASEIESFIRSQQENLTDISTSLSGSGFSKKVENVAVTNTPPQLTKEEMLKEAFEDAASNAAVNFMDKVNDFLVIRNAMKDYANDHGHAFTSEEIEDYIRTQEKAWDNRVTEIFADGSHVEIGHVSDNYQPEPITKEKILSDGFAEAASNRAVNFVDADIDFKVIKKIMMEYAQRWNMEISEEEIVAYIKDQFHKMNEAVKDFSHEFNAMK